MLSIVVYGRNDAHGYNLQKRVALSLNCMAAVLDDPDDEILFVDYNSPDDHPTFAEAIQDVLTPAARSRLRVLRVRASQHERFRPLTHLNVLEPVARNVAIRRSNPRNRWVLATNSDMIFIPREPRTSLSRIAAGLDDGHYHVPRFELPEALWEALDRGDPETAIRRVADYGRRLHLLEDVRVGPPHEVDAPGDFQLILRADLFAMHGFDESMLLGWHLDANISRRLALLRGPVRILDDRLTAWHTDHTRQATATHGSDRLENDWTRFVDEVAEPALPDQADTWGLADCAIEEIRLRDDPAEAFVQALQALLPPPPDRPYGHLKTMATYNDMAYPPEHVLPYLADLLSSFPRDWDVAWYGCRTRTFALFAGAWQALGFRGRILVEEPFRYLAEGRPSSAAVAVVPAGAGLEEAAFFVTEFGLGSADGKGGRGSGLDWTDSDIERLAAVRAALEAAAAAEQDRAAAGRSPRRFVLIGAVHNTFEATAGALLELVHTPFATRLRQGFVRRPAPGPSGRRALAQAVRQGMQRSMAVPSAEIIGIERRLTALAAALQSGDQVPDEVASAAAPLLAALDHPDLPALLPALAGRIDAARSALAEARPSRMAADAVSVPILDGPRAERPLGGLADIGDWERPAWFAWLRRFFGGNGTYDYFVRNRHYWTYGQVLQGLSALGVLGPQRRILVLARAPDGLYAALSELVGEVVVLDLSEDGQGGGAAWRRPIEVLRPSRLRIVRPAELGAPAGDFDAVVALHHGLMRAGRGGFSWLASLASAHVAPGGILAFAAEVQLAGEIVEDWISGAEAVEGAVGEVLRRHTRFEPVGGFDPRLGRDTLDRVGPAPAQGVFVERLDGRLKTTGLWFWRARDGVAEDFEGLHRAFDGPDPTGPVLALMRAREGAERADGAIRVPEDAASGHALFGPYLRLPPRGAYVLRIEGRSGAPDPAMPAILVEIVCGDWLLAERYATAAELARGPVEIGFAMPACPPDPRRVPEVEFRVTPLVRAELAVTAMRLDRSVPGAAPGAVAKGVPRALLPRQHLTGIARRNADGTVSCDAAAPDGHVVFGPYLRLPAGPYRVSVRMAAQVDAADAPVATVDVVAGDAVLAVAEAAAVDLAAGGKTTLAFTVPPAKGGAEPGLVEIRVAHRQGAALRIDAVELEPA